MAEDHPFIHLGLLTEALKELTDGRNRLLLDGLEPTVG